MTTRGTQDSAIELLCARPALIEPGLQLVDSRVRLDEEVVVDVLTRDSLGYPMIVLFSEGDVTRDLGRMAAVDGGLHRGRHLIERLYRDKGLDPHQRPRFALLARRFPDDAPRLLDLMAEVEVNAFEYRVVRAGEGPPVLDLAPFHRTSGPRAVVPLPVERPDRVPGPPPSAGLASVLDLPSVPERPPLPPRQPLTPTTPPPASPPAPPVSSDPFDLDLLSPPLPVPPAPKDEASDLELIPDVGQSPDAARRLFMRARESITALSAQVTESNEDGLVIYRVGEHRIAALRLDEVGFSFQVGDENAPTTPVADEVAFNEKLNEVFDLFFNRIEASGRVD